MSSTMRSDWKARWLSLIHIFQITLAARLEKFNLSSVAALTATDELDLASLGEKKVALFALIPDNDSSFNFLVSLLYASTFQELFYSADRVHGGSLPVPVHFLMDEFANVSLPDDFDKLMCIRDSTYAGTFSMKIENTTYVVGSHFSRTAKDTLKDKMKRLIQDDVKTANF